MNIDYNYIHSMAPVMLLILAKEFAPLLSVFLKYITGPLPTSIKSLDIPPPLSAKEFVSLRLF